MIRGVIGPLSAKLDSLLSLPAMGAVLAAEQEREHLLHVIMDSATRLLDADRSTLFLLDAPRGELWSKIAQGLKSSVIRMPANAGLAGYVATTGEMANIADAYNDSRFNPDIDAETGYRTRNLLCMPLKDPRGKIVGVIEVINRRNGNFTLDDEGRLAGLCAQAAVLVSALDLERGQSS
jgi:adenylate cyclase